MFEDPRNGEWEFTRGYLDELNVPGERVPVADAAGAVGGVGDNDASDDDASFVSVSDTNADKDGKGANMEMSEKGEGI